MPNGWTPERRAQQSEAIKRWKPWKRSTGPRTAKGKAAARNNGWKGGHRPALRALSKALREQGQWLDEIDRENDIPDVAGDVPVSPDATDGYVDTLRVAQ